jgi:DNA-binding HxlR family transcriptional regulator
MKFQFSQEIKDILKSLNDTKLYILEIIINSENKITYSEIKKILNISDDLLNCYLKQLQKAGWVRSFIKNNEYMRTYSLSKFAQKIIEDVLKFNILKNQSQNDLDFIIDVLKEPYEKLKEDAGKWQKLKNEELELEQKYKQFHEYFEELHQRGIPTGIDDLYRMSEKLGLPLCKDFENWTNESNAKFYKHQFEQVKNEFQQYKNKMYKIMEEFGGVYAKSINNTSYWYCFTCRKKHRNGTICSA